MTLALPNRVRVASYIPHRSNPITPITAPHYNSQKKTSPDQTKINPAVRTPTSVSTQLPTTTTTTFQPPVHRALDLHLCDSLPLLQVSSSSIVAAGLGTSDTLIHRSSDPPIPILRSTDTNPPIHRCTTFAECLPPLRYNPLMLRSRLWRLRSKASPPKRGCSSDPLYRHSYPSSEHQPMPRRSKSCASGFLESNYLRLLKRYFILSCLF